MPLAASAGLRPRRSFRRASQLFQSGHPVVDFLSLQWGGFRSFVATAANGEVALGPAALAKGDAQSMHYATVLR